MSIWLIHIEGEVKTKYLKLQGNNVTLLYTGGYLGDFSKQF